MNCPLLTLPQPSIQAPPSDGWPILVGIIFVGIVAFGSVLFTNISRDLPKIIAVLLVLPGILMMFSGWVIDFCVMRPWVDVTINTWEDAHTIYLPIDCFNHYHYLLIQTTLSLMRTYTSLATGSSGLILLGLVIVNFLAQRQRQKLQNTGSNAI